MSATLDRSLDLLEALAQYPQGLSLADISRHCHIAKGTAHRLLLHLATRGYVRYDERTAMHLPTMQMPVLASRLLERMGFLDVCQPELDRLADLSGELARLVWRDGERLVYIAEAQGAGPGLRYDANLGRVAVLHTTAAGKTWLAGLAGDHVKTLVRAQHLLGDPSLGPCAIKSMSELMTELARTRRRAYGLAIDETEVGTSAVAVSITPSAIAGRTADALGCLAIVGPTARFSRVRMVELVPAMQTAAASIAQLWPIRSFCRGPEGSLTRRLTHFRTRQGTP